MVKSPVIIVALSLSPISFASCILKSVRVCVCVCACVCVCVCVHSYFMPILSTCTSMQFLVTCLLMLFIVKILSFNELNITSLLVIILE